jgi:hypothetical protein
MTRTASSRRWRAAAGTAAALALLAAPAAAQAVRLELHPRAGDTLRMRLTQQVEMTGTMRVGVVDSTSTVVTTLRALTHSVVERSDASGTVLVTTTDSVDVTSTGGHTGRRGAGLAARARRALQGRAVRLRVARDGTTAVVSREGLSPELQAFFSQMPATLPSGPVAVGDRWTRTMDVPAPGGAPGAAGGVSATFRLDSLSRGGSLAHLSMRGVISRPPAAGAAATVGVAGAGEIVGALVVDRRRGWLSDARTTLTVRSTLTPTGDRAGAPLHFRMRVDEWLRAVER